MAGLFPFDVFDLSDAATAATVEKTYAHWRMKGTSQWTGWCVPWAAVLETHLGNAPASVELLHAWDEYFTNPGHASIIYPWKPGFGRYGKLRHRHGIRDRKSKRRLDAYAKEKNGRGRW